MARHEASCSCGSLRAVLDGEPVRVSVCHCLACQRRTGSAFGVQARFTPEQVTVSGESREFVRLADEDAEPRRFRFCPDCGSTVFYDYGEDCEVVVIPVGAFADPLSPAPQRTVFEDRRHPWVKISLPRRPTAGSLVRSVLYRLRDERI